jgi:hypothetical protein
MSNTKKEFYGVDELCCDILNIAEELFGKRQPSDFVVEESGNLYPHFEYYNALSIELCKIFHTKESKTKECYLGFELAHEMIHLLTPVHGSEVTNFEEGVATFFSFYYLQLIGEKEYAEKRIDNLKLTPNYLRAYNSVKNIEDLFIRIKKIRKKEPTLKLSRFKNEHFSEFTDDSALIHFWTRKFQY